MKERKYLNNKILVTGGAGYVGSNLIGKLLDKGTKVRCLDLLMYGDDSIKNYYNNKNFELIKGDIRSLDILEKSLEGIGCVVHLAAIVGDQPCLVAPKLAYKINFTATKLLVDTSIKKKINKFIFSSTCSNYGETENDSLVNEESKLNPVSLYAETKIDCERYISSIDSNIMTCVILRFATAFGVSNRTRFDLTVNSFAYEAITNKQLLIFAANTWRPYIHVNDMSDIIIKLINSDKINNTKNIDNIFNAGFTDQNYTKKNLLDMLKIILPETKIRYIDNDVVDKRNYKVDFSKINKFLNIKSSIGVNQGLREIVYYIKDNKNIEDIFNKSNLEALKTFFSNQESKLNR